MVTAPKSQVARQDRIASAIRMAELGDLEAAKAEFAAILAKDWRNAGVHFNLAMVREALGEIDDAAAHLTIALRLKPQLVQAARRLSRLLARFQITDPSVLDPAGLEVALSVHGIAHQPIAETMLAIACFQDAPMVQVISDFASGDRREVARGMVVARTHEGLKSERFLLALPRVVVRSPSVERLLTGLRRALLLETPAERFQDRDLYAFALALMQTAANGDYAWAETPEEIAALESLAVDPARIAAGDIEASRRLLLAAMYRPAGRLLGAEADSIRERIRPKPLRAALAPRLAAEAAERRIAATLPRLNRISDPTSQRVAGQYEKSPYPRWTSAQTGSPDRLQATLGRFFPAAALAPLEQPFDVLIAGAGTGQQVVQSASTYGPKARVLAIDISAASLAYAKRMAAEYGLTNVEFMVADILDLGALDRQFRIIECVGVLHHMADPWAGWRILVERMAPGGLAYIALYSAISRANLRALRSAPGYPGAGCSDNGARAWRAELMARPADAPGAELVRSRNFFSLNEFRDLALHESEQHMSLPQIAQVLDDTRLRFAGFTLEPQIIERFAAFTGQTSMPGTLEDWHRFEQANPQTFDAMYCFWTEKLRQTETDVAATELADLKI